MNDLNDSPLPHLGFRKFSPCLRLIDFVDCYWFINADTNDVGYSEYLHPDGGVSVIFNYGHAIYLNDGLTPEGPFVDGANTLSSCLRLTGKINAIGIRFKPAGAYAFFSIPLHEFKNQVFSCDDMNKRIFIALYEQLPLQADDRASVNIIDKFLCSLLLPDREVSAVVPASIRLIKRHRGILPIAVLARTIGVAQRQLERVCRDQIGVSPVELARTERVRQAREMLKNTQRPLSYIAYELGFYDQSHFVNQFRKVVGITPGEYRRYALESHPRGGEAPG